MYLRQRTGRVIWNLRYDSSGHIKQWKQSIPLLIESPIKSLLPHDEPNSVASEYRRFAGWGFLASTCSAAASVLSTQALLRAVGIGAVALPAAALTNWILKDGAGQLGGVMFAAWAGTRFDGSPRRWRFISAVALDFAMALEVAAPAFPEVFLPIAVVANFGKNVSWISASASRAAIHKALTLKNNLGDVTAKAASQTTAAGVIGMAIGLGIASSCGSNILIPFCILSVTHLCCITQSLLAVPTATLNKERADILFENYLTKGVILSPGQVGSQERFWSILPNATRRSPIKVSNVSLQEIHGFYSPDVFLSLLKALPGYILARDDISVLIIFEKNATTRSIFQGYLHSWILLRSSPNSSIQSTTPSVVVVDEFVSQLKSAGWDCDHQFIESIKSHRYEHVETQENTL